MTSNQKWIIEIIRKRIETKQWNDVSVCQM